MRFVKYRFLLRQRESGWMPIAVAWPRGGKIVLFTPGHRQSKPMQAENVVDLSEANIPHWTGELSWGEVVEGPDDLRPWNVMLNAKPVERASDSRMTA